MEKIKREFIEFMLDSDVLKFGDFITKSGRKTPYFVNTGNYKTGEQIKKLGKFYAQTIIENNLDYKILYGPAYKGIPLVITTAINLSLNGINKAFCFNRKEEKDHGEGGSLIGEIPNKDDKVLIVEDVITAGTSVKETLEILKPTKAEIIGLIISVNRMENSKDGKNAIEELKENYGIKTYPIITALDICEYLRENNMKDKAEVILKYLKR